MKSSYASWSSTVSELFHHYSDQLCLAQDYEYNTDNTGLVHYYLILRHQDYFGYDHLNFNYHKCYKRKLIKKQRYFVFF